MFLLPEMILFPLFSGIISPYFSGLNLLVTSERIYLTLKSKMKTISHAIGIHIAKLDRICEAFASNQWNYASRWGRGSVIVSDQCFRLKQDWHRRRHNDVNVKKVTVIPTTTWAPHTPLSVIVRLSRQVRKDIKGLRAKTVGLCNGSLYQISDNTYSFQVHIEHLK